MKKIKQRKPASHHKIAKDSVKERNKTFKGVDFRV